MKTIEEAAEEYSIRKDNETESEDAFKAGVKFAESWISVEDELPKNTKPVICKCLLNYKVTYEIGKKFKSGWFFNVPYDSNLTVTHWRPINRK